MNGSNGVNTSGWMPVEYKIIVKPVEIAEKTKGGLLLPESVKERDGFGRTEGVLVAKAPGAFMFEDYPKDARKPEIGDHLMFPRYQANEFKGADGETYWVMQDKAVIAVKVMP